MNVPLFTAATLRKVNLDDLAVIGQKPVGLGFHVGDLGVDRRAQSFGFLQVPRPLQQTLIFTGEVILAGGPAIAPGLVGPGVTVDPQPESTELAQHSGPFGFGRWHAGTGIHVNVVDVPTPAWSFQPLAQLARPLEGSSSLVKAVIRAVSNWPQPSLKTTHIMILGWFENASIIARSPTSYCLADSGERHQVRLADRHALVSRGHVLPDEQAESIAPIIPASGFDFDMLRVVL